MDNPNAKLEVSRGTLFWVLAASFNQVEEAPATFLTWQAAFWQIAPALRAYDRETLARNMLPRLDALRPQLGAEIGPLADSIYETLKRWEA